MSLFLLHGDVKLFCALQAFIAINAFFADIVRLEKKGHI